MAKSIEMMGQVKAIWGGLSGTQKLAGAAITLAVFATVLLGSVWASRPDWQQLRGGLSTKQAEQVMARLDESGIRYKAMNAGSSILVDAADLDTARGALARGGLLAASDEEDESASSFLRPSLNKREATFARARQAEKRLARRLKEFEFIEDASVTVTPAVDKYHKAGSRKAKASVRVQPTSPLSEHQVLTVAHIVAGGVDGLSADDVAIMDSRGIVLKQPSANGGNGPNPAHISQQLKLEREKEMQVQEMLDVVYGPRKVMVRVSVEMDWERSKISETKFNPDSAVTLEKRVDKSSKPGASRVPGGTVGAAANGNGANGGSGGGGTSTTSSTLEKKNFDMTEREVVDMGGTIKRLSVGVFIDKELGTEVDQIKSTIAAAVGLDTKRGDEISVTQAAFTKVDDTEWREAMQAEEQTATMFAYVEYGLYGLAAVLFVFFGLRTIKKAQRSLREVLEVSLQEEPPPPPKPKSLEETVLEAVDNDSELAGRSLKRWLYETSSV